MQPRLFNNRQNLVLSDSGLQSYFEQQLFVIGFLFLCLALLSRVGVVQLPPRSPPPAPGLTNPPRAGTATGRSRRASRLQQLVPPGPSPSVAGLGPCSPAPHRGQTRTDRTSPGARRPRLQSCCCASEMTWCPVGGDVTVSPPAVQRHAALDRGVWGVSSRGCVAPKSAPVSLGTDFIFVLFMTPGGSAALSAGRRRQGP